MSNKAWFWGAYGKQDIEVGVIGFLKPGATDPNNPDNLETDLTVLENYNVKLNVQPWQPHRFSFLYTFSDKVRNARGAGPLNPPETTFRQSGPTPIYKVGHQWVRSDRLLLRHDLRLRRRRLPPRLPRRRAGRRAAHPRDHQQRAVAVEPGLGQRAAADARSRPTATTSRPTCLGGDHALKFGARYRDTPFDTGGHFGGFATARCCNGAPVEADLHRDNNSRTSLSSGAAYLQDSFTRGRLTINAGVRVDYQKDQALAAEIGANPIVPELLPALDFPGADSGVSFLDISPRFGATWDLSGDGKTVVKVSANRFYGQFVGTAGILNPVGATLGALSVERCQRRSVRAAQRAGSDAAAHVHRQLQPGQSRRNVISANRVDPDSEERHRRTR